MSTKDKKKVTDLRSNIRKRMGEPPSQSFLQDMLDTAQLKSSMLRLSLDDIQRYERNPRWTRNPDYNDIKASIRERGLDQPLVVTLRPGDRHHTLKKGGGTRYQILRELWEETGEKRFYELEVVVEPYKDELDLFIGHGIENLKRGQMSFIEAAKFYCDLKQIHEDVEGRELSTREACELINKDGFSLHQALIGKYQYALHLYQFIPLILEAGAGRPVVEKIRKHEKVSRDVWQQHSENLEQFETLWGEALAQHDHDDPDLPFDLHGVQAYFENSAGALLDVSPQHLSALVDLALHQPDRTAMSELSSGPGYAPEPPQRAGGSLATPPSSAPAFTGYTNGPEESGEDEDDDNQAPLTTSTRSEVHREQAAPAASRQPAPSRATAATSTTPARTPAAMPTLSSHTEVSLLPKHFQFDAGPMGGYEALYHQVQDELATWQTARDHDTLFRATKPVVAWANTILGYFSIPSVPEPNDPPGQLIYLFATNRQLHLRAPHHHRFTGNHIFDFVWLRIAQILYGPTILEGDQPSMQTLIERVIVSLRVEREYPEFQVGQLLHLYAVSPLVFADPVHTWLDQALHSLQAAAYDFLLVRRQQTDPTLNPLGPITPQPQHP